MEFGLPVPLACIWILAKSKPQQLYFFHSGFWRVKNLTWSTSPVEKWANDTKQDHQKKISSYLAYDTWTTKVSSSGGIAAVAHSTSVDSFNHCLPSSWTDKKQPGRPPQPVWNTWLQLTYLGPVSTVPFQLNVINLLLFKWQGVRIATFAFSNEKRGEVRPPTIGKQLEKKESYHTHRHTHTT